MKTILFFEQSSGFGGSASALVNLTRNLDKQRYRPIVIYTNHGSQIDKLKDVLTIKVKQYKEPEKISSFRYMLDFVLIVIPKALRLFFIIKRNRVNLIHVNTNVILGIPAIVAAKLAGLPLVCHVRETRQVIKREKIFIKWVDRIIVINKKALENYKHHTASNRVSLVYDGIDLDICRQVEIGRFRREFSLDAFPLVGLIGRIIEGKGHKEFIFVAREVIKKKPEAKFLIVGEAKGGDVKYCQEVKKLVLEEGLSDNVIFTGWRNDIQNIITDLNILVQATTTFPEGFGLTIVEAMALEKPVVATNIPGPSDIVVDEKTGFVVSPGDIRAMADKILYLLDHPDIAKTMGGAGRKRAEELFDIKKQVKKIEQVYEEVLNQ